MLLLINTGLQPGVWKERESLTAFSGFPARQGNCRSTGLKPGVNEKKRRSSTCLLEFSDNLLTWGVLGSANLLNRLNGLSSWNSKTAEAEGPFRIREITIQNRA